MHTVVALLAAAQVTVQAPGMEMPERRVTRQVELFAIVQGEHDRANVATQGFLSPLSGPYLMLEDGPARVMVIPMPGTAVLLEKLIGRALRVEGFVRRLYQRQGFCLDRMPVSYCDDP